MKKSLTLRKSGSENSCLTWGEFSTVEFFVASFVLVPDHGVHKSVCPFTAGPEMAGLPMGKVYYTVERCTGMEEMYAQYWKEVVRVELKPERELSTTLLICPEFCIDNIELFESFTNTLTQPLAALGVEDLLQLVFFHPNWTFRDGGDRFGAGAAANYARRSPWPMINLLRTKQVRAAQKGIPTGLVYTQVSVVRSCVQFFPPCQQHLIS